MDLSLPRVDGWEATRRLRSDPRTAAVPVVALTAHAIGGYRERALDAGFAAYLTKPIDEDELFATLRRLTRPAPARPVARDPAALLAAVREHLPGLLSAARDAHDRGDLAALAGVAHQLKGGAQMAALAEVGALARRLEDAARSGDAARAGALLAAVEASAAALLG
jgi:CheY-like chemotaxis protein